MPDGNVNVKIIWSKKTTCTVFNFLKLYSICNVSRVVVDICPQRLKDQVQDSGFACQDVEK